MRCVGHASAAAPSARAKPSFIGRPAPKSARAEAQQMREISKHQTIISSRLLMLRQGDHKWAVASPAPVNRATIAPDTFSRKAFQRTWLNPSAKAPPVTTTEGKTVKHTD